MVEYRVSFQGGGNMSFARFFGHDIDFTKAATMFTIHHLLLFTCAIVGIILTLHFAQRIKEHPKENRIKIYVAVFLIILELTYHIHNLTAGIVSLPIHLSSLATLLCITLLFTDSKRVFQYAFFFGTVGGFMALAFPNSLGYTYYNFRYYHFILLHVTILMVPLYYYKAYGYRVTYKKLLEVYSVVLVLGLVVNALNGYLGTNYWFIHDIPRNVSGAFKRYPVYIVTFFALVFSTMNVLYYLSHYRIQVKELKVLDVLGALNDIDTSVDHTYKKA